METKIEIGANAFGVVYSPGGLLFLICTECEHWVRKLSVGTELRGIVCVCTCHRPSVIRVESEMNEWVTPKPVPSSSVA